MTSGKKYGLRCFQCGERFKSKEHVHRHRGIPLCEEHYYESLNDEAECEEWQYKMDKWHREHPGELIEDYEYQQALKRKYGEY